jgi:CheY-like chemotaxis protein
VLLRYGITVELANNGLEAFEKRRNTTYDLIFMDIQMPVMDGIEATHEIINYEVEEQLEHIPIIALTANALNGDRERFLTEGLDEYIPKPIETNELLYILKKFLKAKVETVSEDIQEPSENSFEILKDSSVAEETTNTTTADGLILLNEEPIELNMLEKDNPIDKVSLNKTNIDKVLIDETLIDENSVYSDKKILILKKNPLEAQILSKVIANMHYHIEIVNTVEELGNFIENEEYDILLIDKELEQFNQNILKKQHSKMNVILLALNQEKGEHYNTNLIKEVHVGIIKRHKIEQLIKKYRR